MGGGPGSVKFPGSLSRVALEIYDVPGSHEKLCRAGEWGPKPQDVPGCLRSRGSEVRDLCDLQVPGAPRPGSLSSWSPPPRVSEEAGPPGPRRPSRPVLAPPRLTSVPAAAHSPRLLPGSALGRRRRRWRRSEARARRGERAAGAGARGRHDGVPARPAAAVGGGPGRPAWEAATGRRRRRHGASGGEGPNPGEHLAVGEEGERPPLTRVPVARPLGRLCGPDPEPLSSGRPSGPAGEAGVSRERRGLRAIFKEQS